MEESSERAPRRAYLRFVRWTMLEGDRRLLAGGATLGFFVLTWGLVAGDAISVGPRTPIRSILGSGVVAGLFSLISVTLAINQLISSRIFGGVNQMETKLDAGRELRDTVGDIAGRSPPVRTAAFVPFVGTALRERAQTLGAVHRSDGELGDAIDAYVDRIDDYADHLHRVSDEMPAEQVIAVLAGSRFAHHYNRGDELQRNYAVDLSEVELQQLDSIAELLGALSIVRQYFKTIALHQELAELSQRFVFVAFPAVAVALLVPLLYKTNPPAMLTPYLPLIVSASLAVVVAPLVLVLAYMLRIATIFKYTVTVAPFVPPTEWPWAEESE